MAALRSARSYDGVLAFGDAVRDLYLRARLGGARVDVARGGRHARVSSARSGARRAATGGDRRVDRQLGRRGADARSSRNSCSRPIEALGLTRDGVRRPLSRRRARSGSPPPASTTAAGCRTTRCRRCSRIHRDRPRAAAAVRRGAARHPDDPAVRGARLRHPAGLGAVGSDRRAVHAGRTISSSRATATR